MGLVLAPLPAEKVEAWKAFMAEMTGARKAEFEDFNRRYRLTKHEAWLCQTPNGTAIVAIHEGPGAAEMMPAVGASSHAFDKWFVSKLAEIHGIDLSKPPPGPMPQRMLSWNA